MNHNIDIELLNILEEKKLIVFGVGNYFRDFCKKYPNIADKIEFCIDNNIVKNEMVLEGGKYVNIYSPQCIKDINIEDYVILFCSSSDLEMKRQLDEYLNIEYEYFKYPFYVALPCQKIHKRVVNPLLRFHDEKGILGDIKCNTWDEFTEKYQNNEICVIPRLVIVLTSKCSLRCKDCNQLIGHYSHPKDLSKEKIILSLKKIIEIVDMIPCCELIGGEPFLAETLNDVLCFLLEQPKIKKIEITTNATVINKNIKIENLQNPKVFIRVSDYGNEIKQNEFLNFVKLHNINIELLKDMMWVIPGGPEKRGRTRVELIKQYDRCYGGMVCKCLWEDKLFGCVRAASLEELGYTKESQYIEVMKSQNLKSDINNLLMQPYYEACDHCNLGLENLEYVRPAIQM